jgi:cyclopropane-fatty-acyl-phospholipid synthase
MRLPHGRTSSAASDDLRESAVAIHTDAANAQHYELPPRFFELCLGKRLKYSSCYYPRGNETLEQAEEAMLSLYGERAELADGQDVLELGCGWGSLTLWMAQRYPQSRITAVSNSAPQREFILARCRCIGFRQRRSHHPGCESAGTCIARFDRCVSIEMFEHMRNYAILLERIASWLRADGKLFVHIFCHRELMYPVRDSRRRQLDGPPLLHRRTDAVGRYPAVVPARPDDRTAMATVRHALREDG